MSSGGDSCKVLVKSRATPTTQCRASATASELARMFPKATEISTACLVEKLSPWVQSTTLSCVQDYLNFDMLYDVVEATATATPQCSDTADPAAAASLGGVAQSVLDELRQMLDDSAVGLTKQVVQAAPKSIAKVATPLRKRPQMPVAPISTARVVAAPAGPTSPRCMSEASTRASTGTPMSTAQSVEDRLAAAAVSAVDAIASGPQALRQGWRTIKSFVKGNGFEDRVASFGLEAGTPLEAQGEAPGKCGLFGKCVVSCLPIVTS